MKTINEIKELNKDTLLKAVGRSKRKVIESLLADVDVHYVVLLESQDMKRRNLLTVGPSLDYPDLDSIADLELDGLVPVAYVNAQSVASKHVLFRTRASEQIEQLEALVAELRKEKQRLHLEVDQALKTVEQVRRSACI